MAQCLPGTHKVTGSSITKQIKQNKNLRLPAGAGRNSAFLHSGLQRHELEATFCCCPHPAAHSHACFASLPVMDQRASDSGRE